MRADFDDRPFRYFLWAMAGFYAYGAAVHVMNIAGLSGFAWGAAPLKWQALDIVYLAVDVGFVVGVVRRAALAVPLLAVAALSQIALYTLGRTWILDVPAESRPGPEAAAYLDSLVIFHVATLAALAALLLRGVRAR